MAKQQKLTFEEWYSRLLEQLAQYTYLKGKMIDPDLAENDYKAGRTPRVSLNHFIKEWGYDSAYKPLPHDYTEEGEPTFNEFSRDEEFEDEAGEFDYLKYSRAERYRDDRDMDDNKI